MKLKHTITATLILILLAALATPSISQTGVSPRPTPTKPATRKPRMLPDAFLPIPDPSRSPLGIPDPNPGWNSTSSFLIGSVAISIIFVESDGTIDTSTENWTSQMLDTAENEIQAGLAWWVAREADADLEMVYLDRIVADTSYEPITRSSTQASLWIGEIMTDLGYSGNHQTAVRDYINDRRTATGTDWALAIFVVNDLNDADNAYTNGYFAWALYGGPYMSLTYGNDGWGIANMDAVAAHEFAHIFWALDQYDYGNNSQECDDQSGYLYEENQNLDIPAKNCDADVASIMRNDLATAFAAGNVDQYARSQLGWDDTDTDDILDPVDTVPAIYIKSSGMPPNPTLGYAVIFTGTVIDIPLESSSPAIDDCSINDIWAQKRLYRDTTWEPWRTSTPADGEFNSSWESFHSIFLLEDGTYYTRVRARNEAGNTSAYTQTMVVVSVTGTLPTMMLPLSAWED